MWEADEEPRTHTRSSGSAPARRDGEGQAGSSPRGWRRSVGAEVWGPWGGKREERERREGREPTSTQPWAAIATRTVTGGSGGLGRGVDSDAGPELPGIGGGRLVGSNAPI